MRAPRRQLFRPSKDAVPPSKTLFVAGEFGAVLTRKTTRIAKTLDLTLKRRFAAPAEHVVKAYFQNNVMILHKLANEVGDGEVAKMIKIEWTEAVNEVWKARSVPAMNRVIYSQRQYMRLKHILGSNYNLQDDNNEPLLVDSVQPPNLASLRFVRDSCTDHRNAMEIVSVDKGATMSLIIKLRTVIQDLVQWFGRIHTHLWLQFAGDGCGMGKLQQTVVAFRVMGIQGMESNSPFNMHALLLYQGDDGYTA